MAFFQCLFVVSGQVVLRNRVAARGRRRFGPTAAVLGRLLTAADSKRRCEEGGEPIRSCGGGEGCSLQPQRGLDAPVNRG
jgi:hypothetical protein